MRSSLSPDISNGGSRPPPPPESASAKGTRPYVVDDGSHKNSYLVETPTSYLVETVDEKEKRIRELFDSFDHKKKGVLDPESIRKGLRKLHHLPAREKYANELFKKCDTSHDGLIQWDEFKAFVDEKEIELWELFCEIDKSGDMILQRDELQSALEKAGIKVTKNDFNAFIDAIDRNNDGVIEFDEWRDFLLLLPRDMCISEIYGFYRAKSQLTSDADVSIQHEDTSTSGSIVPLPTKDSLMYLLAGGLAGAISRSVTAPFDRLKVHLITQTEASAATRAVKELHPARAFTSGLKALGNAISTLYQKGGLRTFYVGNGLNIVKIFPESAIKFLTYESSKRIIAKAQGLKDQEDIGGGARFMAGGVSGITSQFAIYPLETLKTRMQTSYGYDVGGGAGGKSTHSLLVTTAKDMAVHGGWRAYYRGLVPGLVGVFPYAAIDMSIFETLKNAYVKRRGEPGAIMILAFGTVSGAVGATSVYPLNLCRTRLQAQGTPGHPATYKNLRDVFVRTYAKEGVTGFYKGLVPTLSKVIPAVSISWLVYTKLTAILLPEKEKK